MSASRFIAVVTILLTTQLRADDAPLFEKDVRPILKAMCFHCHGDETEIEGGLDLRLRRFIVKGGESGPAIVPSKPGDSPLIERVKSGEMPPGEDAKKLTPQQIAILERWIASGARTARPEPESIGDGFLITDDDRSFWSFQPIERPALPEVKDRNRVRTSIDTFVLERLEEYGFSFAADADRLTLLRRAYFDLIGLPPRPSEVDAFLNDKRPDSYEQLVDRLLASPHYGDRWGRHWLDVAGYSDSEGYTNSDVQRPDAFKYRDYVIRSLNNDKAFDLFIQEQLAGDEMLKPPYRNLSDEQIEKLTATGFLRMAPDGTAASSGDVVARNEVIADTIKIVSTSLLGLTVGCARCHHHRYDPISQPDYYRFRAIFEPAYDWKAWKTPRSRRVSLYTDEDIAKSKEIEEEAKKIEAARVVKQNEFIQRTLEKELAKLPDDIRETVRAARETPEKKRTDEQVALLQKYPSVNVSAGSLYLYDRKAADELKKMTADAKKVRDTKPKEEFIRALTEVSGKIPATFVFSRGDHEQPRQEVQPAELTIVSMSVGRPDIAGNSEAFPTSGRRMALAKSLTDGKHPLVARVLVNRMWMHHFGKGLVTSAGDFGALGEQPSHPELLDWLATEFVESGWSLKRLHRLIMTSTVYRQSFERSEALRIADPDNRLLGGMNSRRLEAEAIRDSVLVVSGKLNSNRYGPPIPVMADRVGQFVIGKENLNAGRPGAVVDMKGEQFRKSVFVEKRRSRPLAVLDTFDEPAMTPNCEQRTSSTVAPQSLFLMNSDFIVEQSKHFAGRVIAEAGNDQAAQIRHAWRLAFAAEPEAEELEEATAYLKEQTADLTERQKDKKPKTTASEQALASFCQALLSSNRFLYVD
ncbi:MAG: hypothetical protein CMJ78_02950 [Planctomycetaceae bacterium]|nr:hypothetical protein [Planctomycetaceae bacterium]